MRGRRAAGQAGFIITLELVLIFSILGIGLLVGIVAVRNALFVYALKKQAWTVWVYDSTPDPGPILLGPARDFDEHEAPRLFYIDREVDWGGAIRNYRAFIGVRDDRFTSRHRIFYQNSTSCGADGVVEPCIVRASNELGDSRAVGIVGVQVVDAGGNTFDGTGRISQAGGIGYLYGLQPGGAAGELGPSYGIGRDVSGDGFPGDLYRECDGLGGPGEVCNCDPATIRSVWTSQRVVDGQPCEPLPGGATVDAAKCPDGRNGAAAGDQCLPPADPRCVTEGGGGAFVCSNFGASCSPGDACNFCTSNPAIACTVGGIQCQTGLCTAVAVACADNSDCVNGSPGTCSLSGAICTTAVQCGRVCTGNTSQGCASNGICASNGWGTCSPAQTCTGAVLDVCVGGSGACDDGSCVAGGGGSLVCACPPNWVDYGANCCPPGTIQATPGQCTLGNEGDVVLAVPVTAFNDVPWTTPFRVNLPPDPNDFYLVEPGGFEGAPGTIGDPYDPSGPIDFSSPNDGVEGSPP